MADAKLTASNMAALRTAAIRQRDVFNGSPLCEFTFLMKTVYFSIALSNKNIQFQGRNQEAVCKVSYLLPTVAFAF
jgi:hypothetical protein